MSEWINIKDKRPPVFERVLTCDRKGNIHLMADCSRGKVPFGITEDDMVYYPPLWWMPLPEPPKESDSL